jgi:hypothetical protein
MTEGEQPRVADRASIKVGGEQLCRFRTGLGTLGARGYAWGCSLEPGLACLLLSGRQTGSAILLPEDRRTGRRGDDHEVSWGEEPGRVLRPVMARHIPQRVSKAQCSAIHSPTTIFRRRIAGGLGTFAFRLESKCDTISGNATTTFIRNLRQTNGQAIGATKEW